MVSLQHGHQSGQPEFIRFADEMLSSPKRPRCSFAYNYPSLAVKKVVAVADLAMADL